MKCSMKKFVNTDLKINHKILSKVMTTITKNIMNKYHI